MALDYLPSPGWAVIYGETPSADRWSELGENDDALATGVGIDDLAIITRHLAALSVTPAKLSAAANKYEELGRATVTSGTPTSMSIPVIAAKKYLKIIYIGRCSSVLTEFMRFNNDSGNNYIRAVSENGAADGTPAYSANGFQGGGSLTQRFLEFDFINVASWAKMGNGKGLYGQGNEAAATAGNQAIRAEFSLKWANTSQQITRVDVVATAGAFIAGSELIVLGHD